MNPRKYLWRGSIFGISGIISTLVNLFLLWLLTQLGLWYLYSGLIGTIVAGVVHYNLTVATGIIPVAGKGKVSVAGSFLRGVQAECGCIVKWNFICPNCENCTDHCDC